MKQLLLLSLTLILSACAGKFIPEPGLEPQAEPQIESQDVSEEVETPTSNPTSTPNQGPESDKSLPKVNTTELKNLHFKVNFKTKSMLKLSDWDSTQVQVLNNYRSSLFWMEQVIQSPQLTQEQVGLMTLNLNQIRNSLYQLRNLNKKATAVDDNTSSNDGYGKVQETLDSLRSRDEAQTQAKQDSIKQQLSWDGRFTEIQNQAKTGYTWDQLKESVQQVERSPMGPALADQLLALTKMVRSRDRKEIANLVFDLEVQLDSGKVEASQQIISTLDEEYPSYHQEFDLDSYRAKWARLNKNLLIKTPAPPADSLSPNNQSPNPLAQDSLSQDSLSQTSLSQNSAPPTQDTVPSLAQIPARELNSVESQKVLAEADLLLEQSKWLQARDVMIPYVNSNIRDQAASRIMKASEAYCELNRSEAAKQMARARGRGRSRQKALYKKALSSLESCVKEFPGSHQAKTVEDNIKMLKSRL